MHARLMGAALAALLLICAFSQAAEARRARVKLAPVPPAAALIDDRYPQLREPEARATARAWKGSAISAPARFIAGRLICAVNVNAALAERGIRGTGSAMAKSFLAWGRPSDPVPGAVAVFNRGSPRAPTGHVAIVAGVEHGAVMLWDPTPSGWRLMPSRRHAIAYRVASYVSR